jgi:hypothetical protein
MDLPENQVVLSRTCLTTEYSDLDSVILRSEISRHREARMDQLWEQLRHEERLILTAIYAFGRTTRDEEINCRWVLAEALRQGGYWNAGVRESLSEYGYVEKPNPEVEKFDEVLIGLASSTRDGIVLVKGLGNFGSPNGDYLAAHPMWRQCALTKEGEALLRQSLPDLPLIGSELASAVKKLSERKGRLVASAACHQLIDWMAGPFPSDALIAIEDYADTGRTKAALKRWRQSLRSQIERMETLRADRERSLRAKAECIVSIGPEPETNESDEYEDDQHANETASSVCGLAAIESAATEKRYIWSAERVAYVFAVRSFGAPGHVGMAQAGPETMLRVRQVIDGIYQDVAGPKHRTEFNTRWRSPNVVDFANTMYQTRDFSAMSVLGDTLMEAGCESEEIIAHCRGDGPHVRGCWVVDLLLEKG